MDKIFEYFALHDLDTDSCLAEMKNCISGGKVVVIRNVWSDDFIDEVIQYLSDVGRRSLPNYFPITPTTPNFHRLNNNDRRAHVGGCFQQFNFFPWNQDYFQLFEKSRRIFDLKNQLSEVPKHSFHTVGDQSLASYTARIAFQFYPAGHGFLNKHSDPVGEHQFALPNMVLSEKGKDFMSGGTYFMDGAQKIYHEDYCHKGDIVMFDASMPHGVDIIDENLKNLPWLSYQGRWMALFSVNKYAGDTVTSNSIDLG